MNNTNYRTGKFKPLRTVGTYINIKNDSNQLNSNSSGSGLQCNVRVSNKNMEFDC